MEAQLKDTNELMKFTIREKMEVTTENGHLKTLVEQLKTDLRNQEPTKNIWIPMEQMRKRIERLTNENKNLQDDIHWFISRQDFQNRKQQESLIFKRKMYENKSRTQKWINKFKEENAKVWDPA